MATAWVFLMTTLLHGYQWFWLQGSFKVSMNDVVFWSVLGVLVWVTVLYETRRGSKKAVAGAWLPRAGRRAVSTLGTFLTISVFWSMWYSGSIKGWLDTVLYWK